MNQNNTNKEFLLKHTDKNIPSFRAIIVPRAFWQHGMALMRSTGPNKNISTPSSRQPNDMADFCKESFVWALI